MPKIKQHDIYNLIDLLISKYQSIYVKSEEQLDTMNAFEDDETDDEGYYYTGIERGENNISEKILKDLQTLSNLLKDKKNEEV